MLKPDSFRFASRFWWYEFVEIPALLNEQDCEKVIARLQIRYAKLTKSWAADRNSEWVCRSYMAGKLIMQATLTINAANYAAQRNLRVVVPYLKYSSLLSLLRALVLTIPEQSWKSGKLITIGHNDAIAAATLYLSELDRGIAKQVNDLAKQLKASRELIAYRAPSSGDQILPDNIGYLRYCALIAELAQLNSELLEASIDKHADRDAFVCRDVDVYDLANPSVGDHIFSDPEDAYRLTYIARKYPRMLNFQHILSEGHVEGFFGSWFDDDDRPGVFNPDGNWSIIFDIK